MPPSRFGSNTCRLEVIEYDVASPCYFDTLHTCC